ncbi:hypothetical protein C8Q75DRAFT_773761 [Abortiporus biennis]|nr:hypothetical protein C8Q75DRAFT_773761 [Abortiporus biennis]
MALPSTDVDYEETLALIASLALEDIDNIRSQRKGKAKAGATISDEELAFRLFAEEANSLLGVAQDAVLAKSIDTALSTDRRILRDFASAEVAAIRDRQFAVALSEGCTTAPAPSPTTHSLWNQYSTDEDSEEDDATSRQASSSSGVRPYLPTPPSNSVSKFKPAKKNDCIICGDKIDGVEIRAPCGHFYGLDCLTDLFRSTINDESLFPPRCCQQPFVLDDVRQHLGHKLASTFERKSAEFATPDRVYCHRPSCSAFIGAATDNPHPQFCPKCFSRTCGRCKEAAHPAKACESQIDTVVLNLAEQEGWKRCPGCRRLVELSVGCYHMTCLCRHQFCYVCTARWKTCTCPQWEEQRLYNAAEERINRQMADRPAVDVQPIANIQRLVIREAERLRENHHCTHTFWRYRSGAGNCEQCNHFLPIFLLQCSGCQMMACVRCRRNRL